MNIPALRNIQRTLRRKRIAKWERINFKHVDYKKLRLSLEMEVEREKPKGFWGWIKNLFSSTKAERKLKLFKNMYPHAK